MKSSLPPRTPSRGGLVRIKTAIPPPSCKASNKHPAGLQSGTCASIRNRQTGAPRHFVSQRSYPQPQWEDTLYRKRYHGPRPAGFGRAGRLGGADWRGSLIQPPGVLKSKISAEHGTFRNTAKRGNVPPPKPGRHARFEREPPASSLRPMRDVTDKFSPDPRRHDRTDYNPV